MIKVPDFDDELRIVKDVLSDKNFDNVISLGFFCSIAKDIESLGLRNFSGPFDWMVTTWNGIFRCFQTNFEVFLKKENLYQADVDRCIYADKINNIIYFHDFSKYKTLDEQFDDVKKKYNRRIKRFYDEIKKPTLFIRYIWDGELKGEKINEIRTIEKDYPIFRMLIKSYCPENEVIFIANSDVKSSLLPIAYVDKDDGDTVNRKPIYGNQFLLDYLKNIDYKNREANLDVYNKKQIAYKSFFYKITHKIYQIFNGMRKEFVYEKQYCHGDYRC